MFIMVGNINTHKRQVLSNPINYPHNMLDIDTRIRIWLHAKKTSHQCILVMSPDTDVYGR